MAAIVEVVGIEVSGVEFLDDVILDAAEGGALRSLEVLEDAILERISDWDHKPRFTRRPGPRTQVSCEVELLTDDLVYHLVDMGTKPTDARAHNSRGMIFRFQGRGNSYRSKTDRAGGGDSRGQVGPFVRRQHVSSRSIRARDITDDSITISEDDMLEAIADFLN